MLFEPLPEASKSGDSGATRQYLHFHRAVLNQEFAGSKADKLLGWRE